jgi:predicted amidophosphoribosyltransferase
VRKRSATRSPAGIARGGLALAASLVAPPRCALCGGACELAAPVCEGCSVAIVASPAGATAVYGLNAVWSATAYDGAAQRLVAALKFDGRLALAEVAAAAVATTVPRDLVEGALIPVPAAPARQRRRGFDPAESIAAALAGRLGLRVVPCLRRSSSPRQVGRPRADRLADPPRVRARGLVPPSCVVVDDVLTTGATLSACARALRGAGAERVVAVTFARTGSREPLGESTPAA